jgi:hypothetical protein
LDLQGDRQAVKSIYLDSHELGAQVAWSRVTWPQELGKLGVLDLTHSGCGGRGPGRSWSAMPTQEELLVRPMFDASITTVQVGDSRKALFWQDRWLDGVSIQTLVLCLCRVVSVRDRKSRLVSEALQGDRWIRDITGALGMVTLDQYIRLWCRL